MPPNGTQKELVGKIAGIEIELRIRIEKLNKLHTALAIEDDPTRRFKYEQQIKDEEKIVQQLEIRINNIKSG